MKNLIGISGKIGSGKDTVATIIQALDLGKSYGEWYKAQTNPNWSRYINTYEIKRFADILKDTVCMWIGCTREQLEDREFKEAPLGEEWVKYTYATGFATDNEGNRSMLSTPCSKEKYEEEVRINWQTAYKSELTPRKMMQLVGTEAGRQIIHPNIWVNALFATYKPIGRIVTMDVSTTDRSGDVEHMKVYPRWVIPDTRFPNEAQAIRDRDGLLIRVNRCPETVTVHRKPFDPEEIPFDKNNPKHMDLWEAELRRQHPSETGLDDWTDWDHVIENDGSLEDLFNKVKAVYEHSRK